MKQINRYFNKFLVSLMALFMLITFIPTQVLGVAHDPHSTEYDYGVEFWDGKAPDLGFYLNAAASYTALNVKDPMFGTFHGEWSTMNLARGLYTEGSYLKHLPDKYFENYINVVENHVISVDGNLDRNKSTEWSRTILAMNALNQDITNIGGYDFIEKLTASNKFTYRQGINGPIWVLLSLNTGNYETYTKDEYRQISGKEPDEKDFNTMGKMIDYIMSKEIVNNQQVRGGWALFGKNPDPDITGMALQGLAPYYNNPELFNKTGSEYSYEDFKAAVERAVVSLKNIQLPNGSYAAFGNTNAESTVQVIVALTALGINPKGGWEKLETSDVSVNFETVGAFQDGVFTNNMVDALLTFWSDRSYKSASKDDTELAGIGGFKHVTTGFDGGGGSGAGVNAMATDQALYGLIAYDRFEKGMNGLYDMTDMMTNHKGMSDSKSYDTFSNKEVAFKLFLNENETVKGDVPNKVSPYEVIKLPDTKEFTGKKIVSWNKSLDGTGLSFKPGDYISFPSLSGNEQLNLYAQYEYEKYKLTLKTDGGKYDENTIPKTFTIEDTIILPTEKEIKKKGYEFLGWYESSKFTGNPIKEIKENTSSDKTLYAKWNKLSVDKLELKEAIENLDKVSTKGMTKESVTDFNTVLNEAKALYENSQANQKEVDSMVTKLETLESVLIVDKSKLQEKINEGKKVLE